MNLGDRLGWVRFVKRYQTNSERPDDADYETKPPRSGKPRPNSSAVYKRWPGLS
jgi:hypothetical protein